VPLQFSSFGIYLAVDLDLCAAGIMELLTAQPPVLLGRLRNIDAALKDAESKQFEAPVGNTLIPRPPPRTRAIKLKSWRRFSENNSTSIELDQLLREQTLHALEGLVAWTPASLLPLELARLAVVAVPLRHAVGEACVHLLRRARFLLLAPGGGGILSNAERALHRVQRLNHALHSNYVAAENYSAGIDLRGILFIWGRPGWLEPRMQTREGEVMEWPSLLPTEAVPTTLCSESARPPRITSVSASRHAVFALTEDGALLYTQVKRSSSYAIQEIELLPLKELEGVHVAQIATRFGQAFAVTNDGSVYAWGMKSGDPCQPAYTCSMGFGEISTLVHPTPLPCFGPGSTPIRFVTVGVSHTIFVSVFGEVYTVGRNEFSKLGLGKTCAHLEQVLSPQKVHFQSRPQPVIVAAAAGARHTLLLAGSGEVWGCGLGKMGILPTRHALDTESVAWTPKPLDRLPCFCTSVAAGIALSLFVGECGEVYFTGQARQTCHPFNRPPDADPGIPYRIPGLRHIEQVSVSMELSYFQWEHVLFARHDGGLYGWGHMAHGEFPARVSGRTWRCQRGCTCSSDRRCPNRTGFCNEPQLIHGWPVPGYVPH